jgi:cephalosporin hydroxylase
MDLTRINLIKNSSIEELTDSFYLENLIIKLGFNTENLWEQPSIVRENGGGLLIWQYPNQFSKYLLLLQQQNINSYIEIGCRWGGTFVLTNEYLKMFNKNINTVAIDIIDSPVNNYCLLNDNVEFIKIDSRSNEFKIYIENNKFDIVFIDGDHSYEGVKNDYEVSKNSGKIFVFHDISSDACPGVVNFWNELKINNTEIYDFFEFVEQYEEVKVLTNNSYLGIGVAIKKYL